jgi:hypothetical protein
LIPLSFSLAIPREKFTEERSAAKTFAKGFFERYPKNPHQTEVEGWRHLQSANVELTMKRLREPIDRKAADAFRWQALFTQQLRVAVLICSPVAHD